MPPLSRDPKVYEEERPWGMNPGYENGREKERGRREGEREGMAQVERRCCWSDRERSAGFSGEG